MPPIIFCGSFTVFLLLLYDATSNIHRQNVACGGTRPRLLCCVLSTCAACSHYCRVAEEFGNLWFIPLWLTPFCGSSLLWLTPFCGSSLFVVHPFCGSSLLWFIPSSQPEHLLLLQMHDECCKSVECSGQRPTFCVSHIGLACICPNRVNFSNDDVGHARRLFRWRNSDLREHFTFQ